MAQSEEVLVGNDGTVETVELGLEVIGDGTKALSELADIRGRDYVFISTIAKTSSVFPSGIQEGDLFPVDGSEVLAVGDKVKKLICSPMLDLLGFSFGFSADWIETSVLKDRIKKYRKGKSDVDGSIKFAVVSGVTATAGGILNQFMKIVEKDGDAVTVSQVNGKSLYIRGVVNNGKSSGETFEFMWARIEVGNINLGADDGSRQEYDASVRIVGNDPVYYMERITA